MDAMRPVEGVQHAYPTIDAYRNHHGYGPSAPPPTMARNSGRNLSLAYPSLHEFMGLELTEEMIRANMPEYLEPVNYPDLSNGGGTVARPQPSAGKSMDDLNNCNWKCCFFLILKLMSKL